MTLRPHAFAVLAALAVAFAAAAQAPAALAAPGDLALFTLGAAGVQVYDCRADEGGALAWAIGAVSGDATGSPRPRLGGRGTG